MKSLEIKSGEIELCINGDENRVIRFNPSSPHTAEKWYQLLRDLKTKEAEYDRRVAELESNKEIVDDLPANLDERIAFVKDTCSYINSLVDSLFGQGTSKIVFGDAFDFDMISSFIKGVSEYFQPAREEKVNPYLPPERVKRGKPKSRKRK